MISKKILITGGAGFIGSHLAHHLVAQGADVLLLDDLSSGKMDNLEVGDKQYGKLVVEDVRSASICACFVGVDVVVHLAGIAPLPECQADPRRAFDVNTTGTANVLECARRAGVKRLLFASTSAVYENSANRVHHEDEVIQPDLVYSLTKLAAENLCQAFATNYGMDIVIPRFFNVYGAHQDAIRKAPPFTSYLARELVMDRQPVLFNDSDARRDYINVLDLVDLLTRMIASQKTFRGEVFNAASGKAFSVSELYEIIRKISGKDIQPRYEPAETFWNRYPELFTHAYPLRACRVRHEVFKCAIASNRKANEAFSWTPTIGIEKGMEAVYDYALTHRNQLA